MYNERRTLRYEKAKYKERLASLKNYARELKARCDECNTDTDILHDDLLKAEHDTEFYRSQIKDINARLKACKGT
jgi:chromosome segregation ATPase